VIVVAWHWLMLCKYHPSLGTFQSIQVLSWQPFSVS